MHLDTVGETHLLTVEITEPGDKLVVDRVVFKIDPGFRHGVVELGKDAGFVIIGGKLVIADHNMPHRLARQDGRDHVVVVIGTVDALFRNGHMILRVQFLHVLVMPFGGRTAVRRV